jgi:hypothetical protein
MTQQKQLEAAVVDAEASLGRAISNATRVGSDRHDAHDAQDAIVDIEKARVFCRQARAALNLYLRSRP